MILGNNISFNKEPRLPNIVFNSMTKAGSEYIAKALIDGLGYTRHDLISVYDYSTTHTSSNLAHFFNSQAFVGKQHLSANPFVLPDGHKFPWVLNIEKYKDYSNKILIHVRDPRQAVLSRTHHTNFYKRGGPFSIDLPKNYFSLTLEQQIDWNIEHYLPTTVAWLQSWLDMKAQEDAKPNGMKILITTYDELLEDEIKLFHKIISFYEIDLNRFKFKPVEKTSDVNYRKGDPNEWRTQMTTAQKQRMAELIPQSILNAFNWE